MTEKNEKAKNTIVMLEKEDVKVVVQTEDKRELKDIEVDKLTVSEANVRKTNIDKDVETTAADMKRLGLRQPIEVRRVGNSDFYEIVDGQRRWLAAKSLGWKTIRAFVLSGEFSMKDDTVISLSADINKVGVDPKDRAVAIDKLLEQYNGDWIILSEILNRSVTTLQKWASYNYIPEKIQEMVTEKKLGQGYARELVRFSEVEPEEMLKIAEKIGGTPETSRKNAIINSVRTKPKITVEEIDKKLEESEEDLAVNIIFKSKMAKVIKEEGNRRSEDPSQLVKSIIREYLDGKGLLA
jgi:ParB family chromosome partitioning protein